MLITALPSFKDNYIWLLAAESHCIVIDPGDATIVEKWLLEHKHQLEAILLTHHHWDHSGGANHLRNKTGCKIFGPRHSPYPHITHAVAEGDIVTFSWLSTTFTVLETPGHTLDHLCYLSSRHLFCGDTLFASGCGRLFEGTAEQLFSALQRLKQLPEHTEVYCAHEYTLNNLRFAYSLEPHNRAIEQRLKEVEVQRAQRQITLPSIIQLEKLTNPFLRVNQPGLVAAVRQKCKEELTDELSIFTALRKMKDSF